MRRFTDNHVVGVCVCVCVCVCLCPVMCLVIFSFSFCIFSFSSFSFIYIAAAALRDRRQQREREKAAVDHSQSFLRVSKISKFSKFQKYEIMNQKENQMLKKNHKKMRFRLTFENNAVVVNSKSMKMRAVIAGLRPRHFDVVLERRNGESSRRRRESTWRLIQGIL